MEWTESNTFNYIVATFLFLFLFSTGMYVIKLNEEHKYINKLNEIHEKENAHQRRENADLYLENQKLKNTNRNEVATVSSSSSSFSSEATNVGKKLLLSAFEKAGENFIEDPQGFREKTEKFFDDF